VAERGGRERDFPLPSIYYFFIILGEREREREREGEREGERAARS
jgi:hypothetical protein